MVSRILYVSEIVLQFKDFFTFSRNPSHQRPMHVPLHRTAFTDSGLLDGFLFSFFSVNLLVRFVYTVQWTKLQWLPVGFWLHVKH